MKKIYKYIILLMFLPMAVFSQYWEKVTNIPTPYLGNYWLDVMFLKSNPNYGWICGFNGRVIRTTDGGNTWSGTTINQANQLESICFTSTNVGYTSGPFGVFKSTDGGNSFFSVTPDTTYEIWGNYFIDDNNGVVVGGGCGSNIQHFWKTTNGGATWNEFRGSEPNSGLSHALLFSANGLGYASSSGKIWRTNDGGTSWSIFSTTGTNLWQENIDVLNNTFIVPYSGISCSGGGGNGGMRMSTNGGTSWNTYSTGEPMFGTRLIDEQKAWACGYKASLYYTSNGGVTWELKNCGIQNYDELDDLYFFNESSGYVVGENVYRIAAPEVKYSKNSMLFGLVCIPESKFDTIKIYNYNFLPSTLSVSLLSGSVADYQIMNPTSPYNIGPCDSVNVIVKFTPLSTGMKNATLRTIVNGTIYKDHDLNGTGLNSTARPSINTIVINNMQCNTSKDTLINWICDNDFEEILSITPVWGTNDIYSKTKVPITISKLGVSTIFTINPKDTGWVEAKFKVKLFPCNKEEDIIIRVYSVSPIINAERNKTIYNYCEKEKLDTLIVKNTGNDDLKITFAYFLNPEFSFAGLSSGRNLPVTIKTGRTDTLLIKFSGSKTGKYSSILKIVNNDSTKVYGNKNTFDIDYKAEFYNSVLNSNDTIFNFRDICIGDSTVLFTKIFNKGNLKTYLRLREKSDIFEVYSKPNNFPIPLNSNDSITIFIKFKPNKRGINLDTLYIYADDCNQIIKIIVYGNGVTSDVITSKNEISSILQTLVTKKEEIYIYSKSDFDLDLVNVYISPTFPFIDFKYSLPNGNKLLINDSLKVELEFTSQLDTIINTSLCFKFQGKCNGEHCLPVKLISLSNWTEIDTDSLDFGTIKCIEDSITKEIIISNLGMQNDTILSIDLMPAVSNFILDSKINLPYYLTPNENLKIKVKYVANTIGKFNDSLKITTKNFLTQPFIVQLFAEFKQSNISYNPNGIDFGIKEICENDTTIDFKIYNYGNLEDSISIFRNNALTEIQLENQYFFKISEKDSVTLRFKLSPNLAKKLGNNSERISFTLNCGNTGYFDIWYQHINPKLAVNPNTINFGVLWAGDSLTKIFKISNNSGYDITIFDVKAEPVYQNYSLGISTPYLLTNNNFIDVPVKFKSIAEGQLNSKIKIYYSSKCEDSLEVQLNAETPKEIYKINLETGNYEIPAGEVFTVHTFLKDSVYKLYPEELNIVFNYDKYLFTPTNILIKSNGTFYDTPFSDNIGEIKINLKANYVKDLFLQKDTLIFIKGMALVSVPTFTPIKISEFSIKDYSNIEITKKDGSLKVSDFCIKGAENKIRLLPLIKLQEIGITNSIYSFEIYSDLDINSEIQIFNIIGEIFEQRTFEIKKGINTFEIDANRYPSGNYIIKINNAYKSLNHNLLIIK